MSVEIEDKLNKIPIVNYFVKLLKKIRLPGFEGLSIYDLLEMYFVGIIKGALTYRASAISFSFFMALFPFLLFILNLIPYVPIEGFQRDFIHFIESMLPPQTANFFDSIIEDIVGKQRGGLLSSVFFLSIFLMANGINAIFGGFETSYHVVITRNIVKQYFVAVGVALLMAFIFLASVIGFIFYEIYIVQYLSDLAAKTNGIDIETGDTIGVQIGRFLFFIIITFLTTALLYYFGTSEGRQTRFFSPGAMLTTFLIIVTTYFFGIYIENFSQYNEIYGSIGALLILMLYIWINSNILLLGFELNASLRSLRRNF
ncbi:MULTISPECIES: YihY/virulence factor BrkB family protein [Galbibacter]|uniref:YihY/virulence factor BrkB family protein n=1 Tax=Galbibacter pacificus TaxID=2996052 RepID=A0ABT6FV34_9FLAO|nr:YihY/virulence factor BrkB family protein [Galbibacter pacificus]MDG3583413.1 YihY/virulence factor BrkB family protein [Galbibacter pacificus]MDG3587110.1 YihY/virulence factor BrkB family protein [Galbibacter pacificus]